MSASQNGWRLLTRAECEEVQVPGGVLPSQPRVATIAGDLAQQWHHRVEPLQWPGCWGYAGPDRYIGRTRTPSNHWSGTAWDLCAPQHPQGVPVHITFTARELEVIADLEARYRGLLVWGGRWTGSSVDGMHWEVAKGASLEALDDLTAWIWSEIAKLVAPPSPSAPLPSPPAPATPPSAPIAGWTGPDLRGRSVDLRGEEGANGPRVQALQSFWRTRYSLYAKHLATDGWWGPDTSRVCREFSHRMGVTSADGRNVGPQVARKLYLAGFRG